METGLDVRALPSATLTFQNNGLTRLVTTRAYDALNRLTNIVSASNSVVYAAFAYGYNAANQRTNVITADASHWVYQYDKLGQVTSGKKYWSDGTAVAGQQFDYAFDDIGNRQSTTRDTRTASYTANLLNQYSSRTVPGYVNVIGEATNAATVTVWTQDGGFASDRHDAYFRAEVTASNSAAPEWLNLTNLAVLNNGTNADLIATNTGHLFVAQTPETFQYDLDGNLTNDGRWQLTWDGENRLVKMESQAAAPTASKLKLEFVYDAQGRRLEKIVSTNNGTLYVGQSTNCFGYDGWNVLAVLTPSLSAGLQYFYWGPALSGQAPLLGGVGGGLSGAGGVGGLLWARFGPAPQFVAYDGNGNVAALVHGTTGAVTAQYEYGPFGELLRATGTWAKSNPFRFSTKYQDDESDLLYYGYRYYNPSTGRWLSRDPIGEQGGPNIYGFVGNSTPNKTDWLGLCKAGHFRKSTAALVLAGNGFTPEDIETAEGMIEAGGSLEALDKVLAIGGAIGATESLEAALIEVLSHVGGEALDVDSESLLKKVVELGKRTQFRNGIIPFTRVEYEECECGFLWDSWSKKWTKPWQPYKGRGNFYDNVFDDKYRAILAGLKQGKEQLKAWREENKALLDD